MLLKPAREAFKKERLSYWGMDAWFRKRRFGWGWTPIRWQGWVVVLIALVSLVAASALIEDVTRFVIALVFITSALAVASYWTSEEYLR